MNKYEKELDLIIAKLEPMNEITTNYYNPSNSIVQDFEERLGLANDMVEDFYCCLEEKEEKCPFCYNYNYEYNVDKRYKMLLLEFENLEKTYEKAVNFMFL